MSSTSLVILLLHVSHMFLLLPVSSENISINGTRGAPWLWPCQHTFSEPFRPKESQIYWQGQSNSKIVVHFYTKGNSDLLHQSPSFKDRTTIFPDQLSSGNFSLVIEPLKLEDDQTSLEVVLLGSQPTKKLCQIILYVAASFQDPNIEINQTEMTAACTTKGGYPKPEITWSSGDGGPKLDAQTTMSIENDGTYSVSSTANITGLQSVTCRVYNPTSNQTQDRTAQISAPGHRDRLYLLVSVPVLACIVALCILYFRERKSNQSPPPTDNPCAPLAASEDSADRNASSNISGGNVSEDNVSLRGNGAMFQRSTVNRDGAAESETNEDATAAADAEQETKLLSDSKKNADETSTSESDKDK